MLRVYCGTTCLLNVGRTSIAQCILYAFIHLMHLQVALHVLFTRRESIGL